MRWTGSSREKILNDIADLLTNRQTIASGYGFCNCSPKNQLLAEEEAKFKLELRRSDGAPAKR